MGPAVSPLAGAPVSALAFAKDATHVAICANAPEVVVYRVLNDGADFELCCTLAEHDQLVSGIDWCPLSGRLLTCAHDRNAYVWTQKAETEWEPTLTILRTQRAALCCSWSPKGNKFAVGTAAKTACVCYFESENNWWVSKLIKKGMHKSSVVDVRWHPNNTLLATASTDGCCRVFSAHVPGTDGQASGALPFSTPLLEVRADLGAWVHSLDWSLDGSQLAFVAHNSSVCVVDGMGAPGFWEDGTDAESRATRVGVKNARLRGLPMTCVWFADADCVVVAGHEGAPVPVTRDAEAPSGWSAGAALGTGAGGAKASKRVSQFAAASEAFKQNFGGAAGGVDAGGDGVGVKGKPPAGPHAACITTLRPIPGSRGGFATAGIDGKIAIWPDDTLAGKMSRLAL